MIAGDDFPCAARFAVVEQDEILDEVEKSILRKHTIEQNLGFSHDSTGQHIEFFAAAEEALHGEPAFQEAATATVWHRTERVVQQACDRLAIRVEQDGRIAAFVVVPNRLTDIQSDDAHPAFDATSEDVQIHGVHLDVQDAGDFFVNENTGVAVVIHYAQFNPQQH
jgi:hypothetical protein